MKEVKTRRGVALTKRLFDIPAALGLLLLLLPLMLAVAAALLLLQGGGVLFRQERVGLGGKPFRLYKFCTMKSDAESKGSGPITGVNDPRITPLGRLLRRFGLDELPQLFNVLKGDMSLTGPRPTLAYQVERYNEKQRRRLALRPGITGLAQIKGRNALSWSEKIGYDLEYVERWSPLLDLYILTLTPFVVLLSPRTYGPVEQQMEDPISRPRQ